MRAKLIVMITALLLNVGLARAVEDKVNSNVENQSDSATSAVQKSSTMPGQHRMKKMCAQMTLIKQTEDQSKRDELIKTFRQDMHKMHNTHNMQPMRHGMRGRTPMMRSGYMMPPNMPTQGAAEQMRRSQDMAMMQRQAMMEQRMNRMQHMMDSMMQFQAEIQQRRERMHNQHMMR